MAITNTIHGHFVDLRCADIGDAEFTLKIRNDPMQTQYVPRVNNTIENQRLWIARQRSKEGDYFFVILDKEANPVGTISCYDINSDDYNCEVGRYLSYGDPIQNVEAILLLYDFVFDVLNLKTIIMEIDNRNKRVINMHKKFGVEYQATTEKNGWTAKKYYLYREVYMEKRRNFMMILEGLI